MPPEHTAASGRAEAQGVFLDGEARPREPLPAEARPLSPEQVGEDDRLAAPGVRTGVVLAIGAGVLVFVATSIALLVGFYRLEIGTTTEPPPRRFPTPRLETNINPRVLPAVLPGPVQAAPAVVPQPSAGDLARAMAMIAAKGAHAYDPLPGGGTETGGMLRASRAGAER